MRERAVWNGEIAVNTARVILDSKSYLINFDKPRESWIKLPDGRVTPCYCNCRFLNKEPASVRTINSYIEATARVQFPDAEMVTGLATAGISWATTLAGRLNLPLSYVRGEQKGYGVGNLVECNPPRDKRTLLIDDALFTGASGIKAVEALEREFDVEAIGFLSIIALSDWDGDNMWGNLRDRGIKIATLTDYEAIIGQLRVRGNVTDQQAADLDKSYKSTNSFAW